MRQVLVFRCKALALPLLLNTYFHTSGSITCAKAYQGIVFEKVDQEYFLSKTAPYLGEFSRKGMVNIYLQNNPAPTTTEDDVLDWFVNLMKKLPNWSKNLVVKDTHTNPYLLQT